jgi:LysM repeat protein
MLVLAALLPVGTASAGENAAPPYAIHVVAWGDTLNSIALRYGVTPKSVAEANHLSDADRVYAGQHLMISGPAIHPLQQEPGNDGDDSPVVHIVQRGETVFKISQTYGVPMEWIIAANNLINPSRIYSGQQLIIPGSAEEANASGPSESTPAQHVVQYGETLSKIAQRYGVSMWTLVQLNNISNPSLLYVGQVLTIPTGSTSSTGGPVPTDPGSEATPPPESTPPQPDSGTPDTGERPNVYTVQPGDTLGKIAARFNLTVTELRLVNYLPNPNIIHAGQQINIPAPPQPPQPTVTEGKQIVVVLSQQRAYAFENSQLLREFIVSTGLPRTPTVIGDFQVYIKLTAQRMTGPGYDLPNVPWVMYFYRDYALHGTYWHNNFGQPMSHGCVNFRTPDAQWLYEWAPMGTPVKVIA